MLRGVREGLFYMYYAVIGWSETRMGAAWSREVLVCLYVLEWPGACSRLSVHHCRTATLSPQHETGTGGRGGQNS